MSQTFETFIKFTTDSVGLERTFRLFQSIVQILSFYSIPFDLLLYTLSSSTGQIPSSSTIRIVLKSLNQRLGLARRFFRVFRSLESFNAAQKLSNRLTSPNTWAGANRGLLAKAVPWIDVFGKTFNGLYLLLEASTLIDALQIPNLALFSTPQEKLISTEAQRFWLFSLVCGALYHALEIPLLIAYFPPPKIDEPSKTQKDIDERLDSEKMSEKEHEEYLARASAKRDEATKAWAKQVSGMVWKLGRVAMANALDVVLPGVAVGWIKADPGTVGVAMLVTTVLTSVDVWERCGREIRGVKAADGGSWAIPRRA
ncbi:peroxisomal biogenesis factor 11 [Annulohypoxylon maeteangense]|uniref:peroxisomal biogenesis factor 11 n=1 Tax=Annulohypoxylon maeteangense TaxID=1927788 RepID=UPI002008DCCE|nr:peroxisomal biogenesis factor 11 [Annulohypoxylon maeteangense]KAI0888356.1 peroxisomal biogenesis factor 11 [Annulohypoxylon maeteangense]